MSYVKLIAAAAVLTGAFFVAAAWEPLVDDTTIPGITFTLTSTTEEDGRPMLTRDEEGDLGDNMEYTCWTEVTHVATGVPDESAVYPIFIAMDVDKAEEGGETPSQFGKGIANYNWRYSNEDWNDTRCKHMIDEFGVFSPDAPGTSGTVTTDWVGNFYLSCYIEDDDPGENELTPGYYVVKKYHPNFPGFCSFGMHKKFQNYHFNDVYGCRLNVCNNGNHMVLASVASCHPWGINQQTTWATFNHGGSIWSDPVLIPGYEGGRREYEDSPVGAVYDDGTAGYFVCKQGPYYPCEGGSGSHEYFKKVDFWGSMYAFAYGNENYWYNPVYPDPTETTYTPYIHDIASSPYPDTDGYIYFACTHFPNKAVEGVRPRNLTIFKWNPHTPNIEPEVLWHRPNDKDFPQIDIYEAPDGKIFLVFISCPIGQYNPREWHEVNMVIFLYEPATSYFDYLFGGPIDVLTPLPEEEDANYFCPNLATSKPVAGVQPPPPDTGSFDIHTLSSKGDFKWDWYEGDYVCQVDSWSDVLYREFTLSWEPSE
jgi:hypothetical protein